MMKYFLYCFFFGRNIEIGSYDINSIDNLALEQSASIFPRYFTLRIMRKSGYNSHISAFFPEFHAKFSYNSRYTGDFRVEIYTVHKNIHVEPSILKSYKKHFVPKPVRKKIYRVKSKLCRLEEKHPVQYSEKPVRLVRIIHDVPFGI